MNVEAARTFARDWHGCGYERGETQKFWLALLRDVCDAERPERIIDFEKQVAIDEQTKFADGYIARTKVLIEQKSLGVDLTEDVFAQAKRYADNMIYSERPRWIVTCNFAEFRIYDLLDMNSLEYRLGTKTYEPFTFKLSEISYMCRRLRFLVDPNVTDIKPEIQISFAAAKIVDVIYNAFKNSYERAHVKGYKSFLDKLCTRLVFCFYASHAQILDDNFFGYLSKFESNARLDALQRIFDTLSTPESERPANIDADLKKFPFVNGGLFSEKILLPKFSSHDSDPTTSIAAADNKDRFNWRRIDLPIFGAMFESILDDNQRREGGIHYTARENIHKVIDPLFLDDLHAEFDTAVKKRNKNRAQALFDLQDKISKLTFLDPACGSGNFLTEIYLSLRELENKILDALQSLNVDLPAEPVKVSIEQFYGIEINDFAVAVAQVAMCIAENQMLQETEGELGKDLNAFPLKHYPKIICANALRVDWQNVFDDAPATFDYIIGNPPYRGYSEQTPEQKADIRHVFPDNPKAGKMDYVCAWYQKAADLMRNTETRCAFISTNSIVQGEQVAYLWEHIFDDEIHIDFARRTFKWTSDSEKMAHVHCVVVAFSKADNPKQKIIFDGGKVIEATNINAYLVDSENIIIKSRRKHFQAGVPKMNKGSQPTDGGNLIIEAKDINIFLRDEPDAEKFIRPFLGADEFIDGKKRYCLWLVDVPDEIWRKLPHVVERVEACAKIRITSTKTKTREDADRPTLFQEIRQPTTNYLLVPRHSSENRSYIPIGFMSPKVIASDATLVVPDATLYHFGVLTSSIHMAWMRATCGRLKSDYRYSAQVVYNNFPWPSPTSSQRRLIEQSAQMILDARAKFSDCTFAKLYDEETMPDELRSAHSWNDFNVARAYGFDKFLHDEAKVVAELMKLYASLT